MTRDEIELKFLNIDVADIKEKINNLGASLKYDTMIESYSFLADGFHRFDSTMKFLRVRKIDDDIRITYKSPARPGEITIKDEIEIKVDDFANAVELLEKLGFKKTELVRKHRVHYELGTTHFELDTLEDIPTYLEIETQNVNDMERICSDLGVNILDGKKGTLPEILPESFIQL